MKRKTLVLVPVVILTIAIGSVAVNACCGGKSSFKSNSFGGFSGKSSFNTNANTNSNTQSNSNSQTKIDIKGQIEKIKMQFEISLGWASVNAKCNEKETVENNTARIVTSKIVKNCSTAPAKTVKVVEIGKDGGSVAQAPTKKVAAVATTVDNSVKAESIVVDNTLKADVAATNDLPKAGESNPFSYLMIGLALVAIGIAVLYYRKRNTVSSWNR